MKDKLTKLYIGTRIKARSVKEEKIIPFLKNERGDIVQTSIIIGILAILAFAVLVLLRDPITGVFDRIKEQLEDTKSFSVGV